MFTATQARNIANEKYNHEYYKNYRWYTSQIMRGITRAAKRGYTSFSYSLADARKMHMTVLRQIAGELNQYGYMTNVMVSASEDGKHKYGTLDVTWDVQG